MKNREQNSEKKETPDSEQCGGGCMNTDAKNLWFIGGAIIILVIIFSIAMFRTQEHSTMPQNHQIGQPVAYGYGGNIDPFAGPVFDTFSGQQVAFRQEAAPPPCALSPQAHQHLYSGNAGQQVAFRQPMHNPSTLPRCPMTHPHAQALGQGQQVAFTQGMQQNVQQRVPPIFNDAVMPHKYRGVCSNCHQILKRP